MSISIEEDVLRKFNALIKEEGFPTRSEAIKQLIKSALVQKQWQKGENIAGVITIIYDHHKSNVLQKIVESQHDFNDLVICSQHAHLDHTNCMENIIVQGTVEKIKCLHKRLASVKGIKHTVLSMTTTGGEF
jgi:CopG family nickel-responsive transcriptional regulator